LYFVDIERFSSNVNVPAPGKCLSRRDPRIFKLVVGTNVPNEGVQLRGAVWGYVDQRPVFHFHQRVRDNFPELETRSEQHEPLYSLMSRLMPHVRMAMVGSREPVGTAVVVDQPNGPTLIRFRRRSALDRGIRQDAHALF
jgi:hypothetical protein